MPARSRPASTTCCPSGPGLYLPGYPVLAAGLALLALSRSTGRDAAGVIDAAIIAIGFGLLSWVLVMVP